MPSGWASSTRGSRCTVASTPSVGTITRAAGSSRPSLGRRPPAKFRCSEIVGYTDMTAQEVEDRVAELDRFYHGNTYHLLERNCNSFVEELCLELTGRCPHRGSTDWRAWPSSPTRARRAYSREHPRRRQHAIRPTATVEWRGEQRGRSGRRRGTAAQFPGSGVHVQASAVTRELGRKGGTEGSDGRAGEWLR